MSRRFSKNGCENMAKKMTEKENRDWDALYQYVKNDIMGYDQNQSLSKNMVLRLKGLLTNKFMENSRISDGANYSYEVILNTFKFCSPIIKKALRTNSYRDENHKFNYILKIVEPKINDVYIRMQNAKKAKEEAKSTTIEMSTHIGAEFKPKEKKNDKFSDLW